VVRRQPSPERGLCRRWPMGLATSSPRTRATAPAGPTPSPGTARAPTSAPADPGADPGAGPGQVKSVQYRAAPSPASWRETTCGADPCSARHDRPIRENP
jgi:hypothetical protein